MSDELWESLPPVAESELPPVRARQASGGPDDIVVTVAIPKSQWQALRRRAKTREVAVPALIRGWVLDRLAEYRLCAVRRGTVGGYHSSIMNLPDGPAAARPSMMARTM